MDYRFQEYIQHFWNREYFNLQGLLFHKYQSYGNKNVYKMRAIQKTDILYAGGHWFHVNPTNPGHFAT
jgi:hypothetical protein